MNKERVALRWCTIVTRGTIDKGHALARRVDEPVDVLVLDDDGPDGLGPLLGDDLERYASDLDREQLSLAVLPRLLARALAAGAGSAAYVAADAKFAGGIRPPESGAVLIDPWPLVEGAGEDALDALVLGDGPATRELLHRWAELADAVLGEDRLLTARTTLRWLQALGTALDELEIVAAGITDGRGGDRDGDGAYGFGSLPDGLPLTPSLRSLLRRAQAEGRFLHPFSRFDHDALLHWLAEPAVPASVVPRYLAVLCEQRPDLRDHFGVVEEIDEWRLLRWAREHGREDDAVLAAVLGAAPEPDPDADAAPEETATAPQPRPRPGEAVGVNVVSYWHSELGVADAARLTIDALDVANVPLHPVAVRTALPASRRAVPFVATGPERHPFRVNLLCLNPDGVLALHAEAGEEFFAGRKTIGYWWWEVLDAFPERWRPAFDLVEEVWVGSCHVEAAIAPASPVPVRVVPIPVLPLPRAVSRSQLGLPDGFLFVTVFDYNSAFERKNPAAVVRAFRAAFPPGSGAALLVKSINADRHPDDRDELAIVAHGHSDIHLRDGYVSSAEMDQLLACADCVVSLHRAEGFGLPLARALRSEIPVLATAYGGNVDFMDDDRGYLVCHAPATVPSGTHYPAGAPWVEPDVEHAAGLLREVFDHQDEAHARARRGAAALARTYSLARTGARMAAELGRVAAVMPRRTAPERAVPADAIVGLRRRIDDPSVPSSVAARLLHELARPLSNAITERRRAVDRDLLQVLARLADAQEQDAIALKRLEDVVAELAARKADASDAAALLAAFRAEQAALKAPGTIRRS